MPPCRARLRATKCGGTRATVHAAAAATLCARAAPPLASSLLPLRAPRTAKVRARETRRFAARFIICAYAHARHVKRSAATPALPPRRCSSNTCARHARAGITAGAARERCAHCAALRARARRVMARRSLYAAYVTFTRRAQRGAVRARGNAIQHGMSSRRGTEAAKRRER